MEGDEDTLKILKFNGRHNHDFNIVRIRAEIALKEKKSIVPYLNQKIQRRS